MHLNIFSVFVLIDIVYCRIDHLRFSGKETVTKYYPHSVYLNLVCETSFICGGSVLNQLIVLTAGHCLEGCLLAHSVYIKYGHVLLEETKETIARDFMVHERYNSDSMANDIAIVMAEKPLKLGPNVKRVILPMLAPEDIKLGYLAGWGVKNSKSDMSSKLLEAVQALQPPEVCRMLGVLPKGTFCAGSVTRKGIPDWGDSGSALIYPNYVQIGIVSHKVEQFNLVVYTNVSAHYDWIKRNSKTMVCRNDKR